MMVKASAASTLLFAAGIFFSLAGPLPAQAAGQDDTSANSKTDSATEAKPVKQSARAPKKHHADRKSEPAASKSNEAKKDKDAAETSNGTASAVPDAVANAKAQMQMMTANAAPDSASAMSARASTVLQASADKPAEAQAAADDATVVATDQLNDVDRALQQETPATQTVAMAAAKPADEAPAATATNDSSSLDKTSLVGKIFIAFGALLTMASAARMFMA